LNATCSVNRTLLNDSYFGVTIQTLDEILRIKKPSKLALEACKLLCLFVNLFREHDRKWPKESFNSWVTVQNYLASNPNTTKIIKEI
jgi:hypothetical protein